MPASFSISELQSLGPKSQAMLAEASITTVEELRRIGSVAAYCLAKRANAKVSLNLLWGGEPLMRPYMLALRLQSPAARHRAADHIGNMGKVRNDAAGD